MPVNYNQLAESYRKYRRPDPRISERILYHIGDFKKILNVGAGIGSYEPSDADIVALEPSLGMILQRRNSQTKLVQGLAEHLPFRDNSFDVSMGILTIHHWSDISLGLKEMIRVTRNKIILLTWVGYGENFWLDKYIQEITGVDFNLFPTLEELGKILGNILVETIKIPHDCTDGFMCAYWRRPEAYLNQDVREAISTFSRISTIQNRLEVLKDEIDSGKWHKKYGYLLEKESLDLGYRIVVAGKAIF